VASTAHPARPVLPTPTMIRFCIYQYRHHPLPQPITRWVRAEEAGFDILWNVDAVNEPDHPDMTRLRRASPLQRWRSTRLESALGPWSRACIYGIR
jgi:hypothetical protein